MKEEKLDNLSWCIRLTCVKKPSTYWEFFGSLRRENVKLTNVKGNRENLLPVWWQLLANIFAFCLPSKEVSPSRKKKFLSFSSLPKFLWENLGSHVCLLVHSSFSLFWNNWNLNITTFKFKHLMFVKRYTCIKPKKLHKTCASLPWKCFQFNLRLIFFLAVKICLFFNAFI